MINKTGLPRRKSIRLKDYDYSQSGLYFLTISVENMTHLFGKIIDGEMYLNPLGKIAHEEWQRTILIRPNIGLGAFIIMPNHMHGIIEIKYEKGNQNKENIGKFKSPSQTIGAIIRGYKGSTTKKIKTHLLRTGELHSPSPTEDSPSPTEDSPSPTTEKNSPFFPENSSSNPQETKLNLPKTTISKFTNSKRSIWLRNYYDIIIRDEKAHQNITNYIKNNPKKWQADKFNK